MISIRSPEVEDLARKLARKKGTTMTEAIRSALEHELKSLECQTSLKEKLLNYASVADCYQDSGIKTDKAFFDELGEVS